MEYGRRLWTCSLVVFSILTSSCGFDSDQATNQETIRLSIVTWPGYGPAFLGEELGFFEDEDIDLEIEIQESLDAKRAALVAGHIDLVGITLETVVLERAQGLPVTFVGLTDISAGGDGVIARNGITSIQELEGKRIAYPEGQPSHLFLLHLLDKASVPFDKIKPVLTEDAGRAGEFFAAGRVDAAVTWEPWLSAAEEAENGGRVIARSDGTEPILLGGFEANSDRLTEESISTLARFFRAWYRSLEQYEKNPRESIPIMAAGFGLPEEEFVAMLEGLRFLSRDEAANLMGVGTNVSEIADAIIYEADLWFRAGVVERVDRDQLLRAYDSRVLAEALTAAE